MKYDKSVILETAMKYEGRFKLDQNSNSTYESVTQYFNSDPDFEKIKPYYSLNKGLLVRGRIGCGKSLLFRIFKEITRTIPQTKSFYPVTANEIARLYCMHGYEIFRPYHQYGKWEDYGLISNDLFIDDIGSEPPANHFGNQINIIKELIQVRYDGDYITHATTNLDARALKSFYGERVFSRFKEMFNDLLMDGDDRRF